MSSIYYKVAHRSQAEIDAFKTRYDDFNTSVIPAIFQSALQLTPVAWEQTKSWGTSHVIYFVHFRDHRDLVLRANTGKAPPEIVMKTEQLITDKVLAAGLKTNEVLYVDVSRKKYPFDFQIEEVMHGSDPEIDFLGTQENYDIISFQLGETIARLSEIAIPGFGLFDEQAALKNELRGMYDSFYEYIVIRLLEDLKEAAACGVVKAGEVDVIMNLFETSKQIINIPQGVLVHHDLADHNIMYDSKSFNLVGVFDWEAAVSGDTVLDLASCPTWTTLYPRKEKLIEGFQSVKQLPDNFEYKYELYRLRTIIWKTYFVIQRLGKADEKRYRMMNESLKYFKIR